MKALDERNAHTRAQTRKCVLKGVNTRKGLNKIIYILMHFKKYNKREYKILITVKNKEQWMIESNYINSDIKRDNEW